jgi:hypothetical protein
MKSIKKIIQTLTTLTILSSLVFLLSCQESDVFEVKSLDKNLKNVFNDVINNNLNLNETNHQIINVYFFNELSKIGKTNGILKENKISKMTNSVYKRNNSTFNNVEKIILKSYFDALNQSSLSSIDITQYYIEKIEKFNIHFKVKEDCINFLIFIRDLMIFINYDNYDRIDSQSLLKRSCLDQCMYNKAKAIWEDGNWVDKTFFILTAAETTAGWFVSCGWTCIKK